MPKRLHPIDTPKAKSQSRTSRSREQTQDYGRSSTQSRSSNIRPAAPPSSYGGAAPQTNNYSAQTAAQSLNVQTSSAIALGLGTFPTGTADYDQIQRSANAGSAPVNNMQPSQQTSVGTNPYNPSAGPYAFTNWSGRPSIRDPFDPVPDHLSLVHQRVVAPALRGFGSTANQAGQPSAESENVAANTSISQDSQTTIVELTDTPINGKICDRCYRRKYACAHAGDLQCQQCRIADVRCEWSIHERWLTQPWLDPHIPRFPHTITRSCDTCLDTCSDQGHPLKCRRYRPPCLPCVSANVACLNLRSPKLKQ
jgi:hypothetical protein